VDRTGQAQAQNGTLYERSAKGGAQLVKDFKETKALLDRLIQKEEACAGVVNLVDPAYPTAAWRLRARLFAVSTLETN
jgi:hypothetical protein